MEHESHLASSLLGIEMPVNWKQLNMDHYILKVIINFLKYNNSVM